MKILIAIPQLIFGGAEKVLVSFANDLVRRGHEVEILELYERGFLKDQFDRLVTFDAICSNAYTRKYYASLAQVKRNPLLIGKLIFSKLVGYRRFAEKLAARRYAGRKFDVAINYLETESPLFLLEHIRANRYLQWFHTDVANMGHPEDADSFKDVWSRMDGIVCVSGCARESFVRRYPELEDRTHLIYNFYDMDTIRTLGRTPYSLPGLKPALLSVGRMTEPKKYLRFLDVLARLRNEGFPFSWHILGQGAQWTAIEEKVLALNLKDWVFLHGVTDNPYQYMTACDLFVLPSGWEGFPTVTVEAKILGCPVLATDVAGMREQLIHGKTGWIVENSEDGIYEGLKYLLQNPDVTENLRSSEGMSGICDNKVKYQAFIEILK